MPTNRQQAAAECAGRDAGDVVDELARLDDAQLDRPIPADRDHVLGVFGEGGARHPVGMGIELEGLLAIGHADDAGTVIGPAKREQGAIVAEPTAEHGVVCGGERANQLELGDAPELDFTEQGRVAARGCQQFAIRREGDRSKPLGTPDQAGRQPRSIGLVDQQFVVARHGDERRIGRNRQTGDDGRSGVHRRILGGDRVGESRGRVVGGPFDNPAGDQIDLVFGERGALRRHQRLFALNVFQQRAFIHFPRHHGRATLAALHQQGMRGEDEVPPGFGRLMTARTMPLQKGANLPVETDFRRRRSGFIGVLSARGTHIQEQRKQQRTASRNLGPRHTGHSRIEVTLRPGGCCGSPLPNNKR